jgi:hypothetical protein
LGTVHLENFVGAEIGSTVSFEIHDGYFYAVSNQSSFETDDIDWNSYYQCYRFPLDNPRRSALRASTKDDMWRRDHSEGPINDSWTDIRMYVDDCTGKLMIAESRREWKNGSSLSQRTYYTREVKFPDPIEGLEDSPIATPATASAAPEGALLPAPSLTTDTPLYFNTTPPKADAQPSSRINRPPRHAHPGTDGIKSPRFILAHTKLRFYQANANAFLDLVDDSIREELTEWKHRQRLRLRVGRRRLLPPEPVPNDEGILLLPKPDINHETGLPDPLMSERFSDNEIHMWPAIEPGNDALFNLLNPFADTGNTDVDAVADDRSIIYATGSAVAGAGRALVLLNFDEAADFRGVALIEGNGLGNVAHVTGHPGGSELRGCGEGKEKEKGKRMQESDVVLEAVTTRTSSVRGKEKAVVGCGEKKENKGEGETGGFWLWEETAKWMEEGRGWIRDAVVGKPGNTDVDDGVMA